MYEYLDNTKKHFDKMAREMEAELGKERTEAILKEFSTVNGLESPEEAAAWAGRLIRKAEDSVEKETLTKIREGCACVITNKYSAYNKRYFRDIRARSADDAGYMESVAQFLSGRPRIGKEVEYRNGEFLVHFGEGRKCGCFVVKGGWDAPPSVSWCRCCQGSLLSVFRFVFPEKRCAIDIVETLATGADDCVFRIWYTGI